MKYERIENDPDVPVATLTVTQKELDLLASVLGQCASGGPTSHMFNIVSNAGGRNRYVLKNSKGDYIPTVHVREYRP